MEAGMATRLSHRPCGGNDIRSNDETDRHSTVWMRRDPPKAGCLADPLPRTVLQMADALDGKLAPEVTTRRWRLELLYAIAPVVALILLAAVTERPWFGGLEATIVLVVVPLAARRLQPLPVFVLVSLGALLTSTESPAPWVQIGAVGLASLTVGERASDRTRSALAVIIVASCMALGFLAQDA